MLAPMAGYTDSAFRLLARENGADVVYTEMTSADALHYDAKKTLEMLKFNNKEKPIVCQLFGKNPATFPKACKIVEQAGFSGIDINFGCPARKVAKHGGGVTLMKDLNKCHEIISTVLQSTKLPVSVKIRKSIGKTTCLNFLKKMQDLNIKAVMIHGRTYEKPFAGEIDYKIIKQARKYFKGIIIANGGIDSPVQAALTLKKTNADGLGLARGLFGRPWLFRDIKNVRTEQCSVPTIKKIKKTAIRHAELLYKTKGKKGMFEIRKHLIFYTKGLPNIKQWRDQLVRVESVAEIKKIFNNIEKNYGQMEE